MFIDLEAAFLVNLSTIINAQGSKTLLALASISIPTGHAFTHTFIGFICKREELRKKHYCILNRFSYMEIMKSLDNKPLCLREEILLAAKC